MSLESYALQIAQKCRLAIAVSILNSKPNDVSIDQYLEQIRNTISDKTDDLNISTCSDDFNIDSDELNIENETSDQNDENNDKSRVSNDKHAADDQNRKNQNKISNHDGSKHLDVVDKNKTIENDKTQDCNNHNDAEHIRKDKFRHLIKELRRNKDYIKPHLNQACLPNQDSFEDVEMTQCYDEPRSTFDNTQVSNSEYMAHELSQNIFENNQNKQDVSSTKNSSNSLQINIKNIDKVTLNHKITIKELDNPDIKNKTKVAINEPKTKIAKKIHSAEDLKANVRKNATEINADSNKKALIQAQQFNADDHSLRERNINHLNPANNITILTNKPILNLGTGNNSLQTEHSDQYRDSIQTNVLRNTQNEYTVPDYTNTYYSQSQVDDITIDSRYIHGNKNIKANTTDNPKADISNETQHIVQSQSQNAYKHAYSRMLGENHAFSQDAQNMDIDTNIQNNATEMETLNYIYTENINENDVAFSKDAFNMNKTTKQKYSSARDISRDVDFVKEDLNKKTNECFAFDKNKTFSQDAQYMDISTKIQSNANELESLNYICNKNTSENDVEFSKDAFNMNKATKQIYSNANTSKAVVFDKGDQNKTTNECFVFDKIDITNSKTAITGEACNSMNQILDKDNITDEDDITTQEERVPFKIIEELNKIRMYLSKNRECSNDTGYFSGTQSKCSDTFSQSSNININEAAICLFNYIVSCDLVIASKDINDQISEVLSKLIDKLHEEDNYPTFIEELLQTVNSLLQHIYEGDNCGMTGDEDVIVKKDEQIQRILLLTKSPHIQKYTIAKINSLFQNLLDVDTNDTVAEIQNISKMENLCYIFMLLQIILKKYLPYSNQSQNTQDERVIRKKCISDLWRQKWIPIFKEDNAGSFESACVLKECMAILNKIIVKFMDGYSLVAYSALNCFNLMQT